MRIFTYKLVTYVLTDVIASLQNTPHHGSFRLVGLAQVLAGRIGLGLVFGSMLPVSMKRKTVFVIAVLLCMAGCWVWNAKSEAEAASTAASN